MEVLSQPAVNRAYMFLRNREAIIMEGKIRHQPWRRRMGLNALSGSGKKLSPRFIQNPEGRCTFYLSSSTIGKPQHVTLQNTDENSAGLLEEWRREPKTPAAMERIMNDSYRGLQISLVDCEGKTHLEGIALYAVKHYGMYLRALETAPWNRIEKRIQGIAPVLVARLALESERNGYGGIVFTIPTNPAAEKFNRNCGFVPFQLYARKTGLSRDHYPLGYTHFMVLDRTKARTLITRQLAHRGNLAVDINI